MARLAYGFARGKLENTTRLITGPPGTERQPGRRPTRGQTTGKQATKSVQTPRPSRLSKVPSLGPTMPQLSNPMLPIPARTRPHPSPPFQDALTQTKVVWTSNQSSTTIGFWRWPSRSVSDQARPIASSKQRRPSPPGANEAMNGASLGPVSWILRAATGLGRMCGRPLTKAPRKRRLRTPPASPCANLCRKAPPRPQNGMGSPASVVLRIRPLQPQTSQQNMPLGPGEP